MLTRLEIDDFKTFSEFGLDVPPFLAILGPNASGKSNLFDAVQFIRRLTEFNLNTAAKEARGELDHLFRRRGDGSMVNAMRFGIEVLLNPRVRDPWGTDVELTQTRLRYELTVSLRRDDEGNVRLFVDQEKVTSLRKGQDQWMRRFDASPAFISTFVRDGRRKSPFLETVLDENQRPVFRIRQDGVQGRARPAGAAEATVLSSMNSAEFKHLYALREEIISWRFLQLDPMSLRLPGEKFGEERLESSGSNLARVLHRIQMETAEDNRPTGDLADISADLAHLIPSIRAVSVRENEQTRKWEIILESVDEASYNASVASDGTLRVLALLAVLYDPKYRGLVCFEEPENGIHPLRLRTLIRYLRELVTSLSEAGDPETPLAQIIVNSHSPVVLASTPSEGVVIMDIASLIEPSESGEQVVSRISRVRRVSPGEQMAIEFPEGELIVPKHEIERYRAAALLDA